MRILKHLGLMVLLSSGLITSAFAASVKLSWQAPPPQTGVTLLRYNVYRVTVAGTETINSTQTDQVTDPTILTFTELNVPPGTYFYKVSVVAKLPDGTTKESGLSNETSAVVPTQVIIVQPPVQQPAQVILP
jgi:hypothetical protein